MKIEPMTTLNWAQVQQWIQNNPYKTKTLSTHVSTKNSVDVPIEKMDSDGWTKIQVFPATPLSAILTVQDSIYQASSEMARKAFLRDETTDLQEKAIIHLKGRAWPVRRTAEGITSAGLEGKASIWTDMTWKALCALRECQIILINEGKKEISFYPENIATWSSEFETFCIDHECRFIWTHDTLKNVLHSWILDKEKDAWTIHWYITDGTMDELKELLQKMNETLDGKLKKDVLQKRIGRLQGIHLLSNWQKIE
jgi:hypothetical protein